MYQSTWISVIFPVNFGATPVSNNGVIGTNRKHSSVNVNVSQMMANDLPIFHQHYLSTRVKLQCSQFTSFTYPYLW